jgi:hypothetical protein
MGLRIALYNRTLFSRDSCERFPVSQLICRAFNVNCCRFIFMCVFHVSLWSKWRPKYFTSDLVGMIELLIVTFGQPIRRVVKVISWTESLISCFWSLQMQLSLPVFAEHANSSLQCTALVYILLTILVFCSSVFYVYYYRLFGFLQFYW